MLFLALGPQPSASTNSAILAVRAPLYRGEADLSRPASRETRNLRKPRSNGDRYLALVKAVMILLTLSLFLSRSLLAFAAHSVLPLRSTTPVGMSLAHSSMAAFSLAALAASASAYSQRRVGMPSSLPSMQFFAVYLAPVFLKSPSAASGVAFICSRIASAA